MGFIDVLFALPRLARHFFTIRNQIIALQPKAVISIDYPGFNLRLAASLKKRGYRGKLIHYICPTVWAWGKGRIPKMAKTLDGLLTLFPFEKQCFAKTSLPVHYVGHPLISQIPKETRTDTPPILAIFPGSRETEIRRNFPLQIAAAKKLANLHPNLQIAVSVAQPIFEPLLRNLAAGAATIFYPPEQKTALMRSARMAMATSGTVTLELALHAVPTIVGFAIRPIDLFIAQKIASINLPFYCIVNIILSKQVFPELFGPHFTEDALVSWGHRLWSDLEARKEMQNNCESLRKHLGEQNGSQAAARAILNFGINSMKALAF